MATRPPIECPICHADVSPDRSLEGHLMDAHSKRSLARFVVSENTALLAGDVA
ncbi:hypothetical protein [Natrarchaeobaculum aegyptiacum]|uniref:hypothetical protein n=1 Tax=Natrarchaeobaculum aegyptiacum TaxID=745377 RepID=UPI0016431CBD|nr:hypothetical protein [Natrarchaeobaculum aegyptiacum]